MLLPLALPLLLITACSNRDTDTPAAGGVVAGITSPLANFAHLDYLGETVGTAEPVRIVHIYAEAPDYHWVGDEDEGIACVDDAARAAVVYLRDAALNGNEGHRRKGEELLRFILGMQAENGLFYNFVLDDQLTINRTHRTSQADSLDWWTARAVWALGVGARELKTSNPALSEASRVAVERTYPHLEKLLAHYGETRERNGRDVPGWLVNETAADATSELLLGLHALDQAYSDTALSDMIRKFADGINRMQWGSMAHFPWSAHASWIDSWHGWGNAQTQALSEIGDLATATVEAENFYPRLLIEGWMHSFNLDDSTSIRTYEQIAYAVRGVAAGLVGLYDATGEERYAVMAGLAAGWFTGNNVVGRPMYDPTTGRGYDGINGPTDVNMNAGAESTIEALITLVEIDRIPAATRWVRALGSSPQSLERGGKHYRYRVFTTRSGQSDARMALVMNLTDEKLDLLFDRELQLFLGGEN